MLQVQEKYLEYLEGLDNELSKINKSNQSKYLRVTCRLTNPK